MKLSFPGPLVVGLLLSVGSFNSVFGQVAPPLGTAQNFAVLGASTVTSTGPTVLTGDLGVSPGTAITGFPPGIVTGTIHSADAVAAQGQADALTAYNFLAAEACNTILTGQDLGGLTLLPGVYCFASSAQLTGTLTLDAQGNPNAVFIFKIGSTLTTASNSAVVIVNGGSPCNVFFQVGSSATLGTGTRLLGTIFALASITVTTSSSVTGGTYALTGAVTLDSNTVAACIGSIQVCKVAGSGVVPGTTFVFNVAGTQVSVPAGPAPGGTCSQSLLMPARPSLITETLPVGTTLAQVSTLPGPGLLISSNLAAGMATVAVNPGGQTIATFIDTVPAITPTTGFLQICKVAGSGVAAGTPFTFNVAGTPVIVTAGPAPGGTCSQPLVVPAGAALITETLPAGTTLTSVSTLPAGALVSSNLATGTATATVAAGGQTIATFTDTVSPTTGFLQICKIAGNGIVSGTNFAFSIAGTPATAVTVPAGPAPMGSCGTPVEVPAGVAVITETVPVGTALTSVSTLPSAGLLVSSNLAAGTANVTVNAGGQTTVTFLNTMLPAPTTGFLQICKVAGSGIAVGTPFTFDVAGTSVTVNAGPAPGGTCSAALQVQAGSRTITETLPAGTALTSVSTVPAGLLVSSNLAGGTAVVTVNVGGQTIATFLDTLIPVVPTTGFLQICKVAGAGVPVGTSFAFNVAGTPVSVAAGPAPGGTCSTPLVLPAGAALITETLPASTTLTSVTTLPAGSLVSSNLAAGLATVTVTAGSQTVATFLNTVTPVVPTTGFLQICKVAGAGVATGTNFTFDVAGTPVTVAAGLAPGGTCSAPLVVPAGATLVTETLPAGIALTSVSTLPAGLLLSSNLTAGAATVTVNAGAQSIATFVDTIIPVIPTTGLLQVCKVAGTGVTVGTNFTFNVAGTIVTVPAGAGPGGSCSQAVIVPAGATVISETLPTGTALTSVATLPAGSLVSSNLASGIATVTVTAGGQSIVTFTNATTTGMLQVCKVAGTGVTVGTNFTFNIAGTMVSVPAGAGPGGSCSQAVVVPAGQATVSETLLTGTALTSVATLPAGSLVSSNLATGTASVTVTAGGQTIVTFTNAATTGLVQVCKVAGTGVTVGTNFTFNIGGTMVSVPAGAGPGGSCSQAVVVPAGQATVSETLLTGTALTSVATLPAGSLVSSNLATGTASVTVTAGGQTIVTFTNAATTGLVQVCKVAGTGVTVGANFTFNIGGTMVSVPAGAGPGGSCSQAVVVPAGQATVSETLLTGTALTSVATLPAGSLVSSNLGTGTASVTVTAGGQTTVTFTNAATTGLLQVCKVAGTGVTVGTNFTFNIAGTMVSVPAGAGPSGSCSQAIVVPAGQAIVSETLPTGATLTSVTTSPAGALFNSNLATGMATVTVTPGAQTTVTFTNAMAAGLLKICKLAGPGITVGTQYSFTVGTTTLTVPAGFCAIVGTFPVGTQLTATETIPAGGQVTAITVMPPDRMVSTPNLTTGSVAFTIGTGVTEVGFTNSQPVELGLLKVCKIAGTGIATGANFNFVLGGANFTVPAGFCVKQGSFPVGTVVAITETFSAGTATSAISVLPADRQGMVDLTARTVSATVGSGVTEVYFTNVAR